MSDDSNKLFIDSIGITAPGMSQWDEAGEILRGEKTYEKTPPAAFKPDLLRPNERRRTTALIKLALQVAEQAMNNATLPAEQVSAVFASAEGDTDIIDKICDALTQPDRPVSPTHFHNSVHNAPAGYWAIATHSQVPSTSLSAGAGSFAGGLLEAATLASTEKQPTLLVCYDCPPPEPLHGFVNISEPFACALLLSPQSSTQSAARLCLNLVREQNATTMAENDLEALRSSNPAARCLPLLQAVAQQPTEARTVYLPYLDGLQLEAEVTPC